MFKSPQAAVTLQNRSKIPPPEALLNISTTLLFSRADILAFVKVMVTSYLIPSIIGVCFLQFTYIHTIITSVLSFSVFIILKLKGQHLTMVHLHRLLCGFLYLDTLSLCFFGSKYPGINLTSLFCLIIYTTIYNPIISLRFTALTSLFAFGISFSVGTIISPFSPNKEHLQFPELIAFFVFQIVLGSVTIFQLAPVLSQFNTELLATTSDIDHILTHIFPPHIAYFLSKTPLTTQNKPINKCKTWCLFSNKSSIYQKHILDPHIVQCLHIFLSQNPDILDPKSMYKISQMSPTTSSNSIKVSPTLTRSFVDQNPETKAKVNSNQLEDSSFNLEPSSEKYSQQPQHSSAKNPSTSKDLHKKKRSFGSSSFIPRNLSIESVIGFFKQISPSSQLIPEGAPLQLPKISMSSSTRLSDYMTQKATKYVVNTFPKAIIIFLSLNPSNQPLSPNDFVFLRAVFDQWDVQILKFKQSRVDKIKVFETCRMLLTLPECNRPEIVLQLIDQLRSTFLTHRKSHSSPLTLSVGITQGSLVAGVWGRTLFQYDIVGKSVNLAARLAFSQSKQAKPDVNPNFLSLYSHNVYSSSSYQQNSSCDETLTSISEQSLVLLPRDQPLPLENISGVKEITPLHDFSSTTSSKDLNSLRSTPSINNQEIDQRALSKSPLLESKTIETCPQNPEKAPLIATPRQVHSEISTIIEPPSPNSTNSTNSKEEIPKEEIFHCIVSQPLFEQFSSNSLIKSHIPLILSLKGIGSNIPAQKLYLNTLISSSRRRRESVLDFSSLSRHNFLRIPFNRNYQIVRYLVIALLISIFVALLFSILKSEPLSVTFLNYILFCFLALLLGIMFFCDFNTRLLISNPHSKKGMIMKSLQTLSWWHRKSYFLSICSILYLLARISFTYGSSEYTSAGYTFILGYAALVIVDHKTFDSEVRILRVVLLSLCIMFLLTATFYQTGEPPKISPEYVTDVPVIFFGFLVIYSLILPLRSFGKAQDSVKHLFQNSLHPTLQYFLSQHDFDTNYLNLKPPKSLKSIRRGIVAVGYFDIANFTSFCSTHSADNIIQLLDLSFSKFDLVSKEIGLIKAPTVGDAYIILSNEPGNDLSELDFRRKIQALCTFSELITQLFVQLVEVNSVFRNATPPLGLRGAIVVHTCFGALVGQIRPSFQYFGPSIDIAKDLQNKSPLNKVTVHHSVLKYLPWKYFWRFPNLQNYDSQTVEKHLHCTQSRKTIS